MPLIQPPVQTGSADELATATAPLLREARQVLNARAVSEILSGLGVGRPQESSALSFTAGLGEAMGALAKGFTDMSTAQQTVMKSVLEQVSSGKAGGDGSILSVMLMLWLMERMDKQGTPKEDTTAKLLERFLDHLEEEAQGKGPSPIDQQMHNLTTQIVASHIAKATDPLSSLKDLAQLKETMREVLGVSDSSPKELSEHALRLRAIEKEETALRYEHMDKVAERQARKEILTQGVPQWINMGGQVLARVMQGFGLTPMQVPQGGGLSAETMAAMAEEEAAAGV